MHSMAKAYVLSGCMWKWIVCVYIVDPHGSQQYRAVTGGVNMKLSSAVKVLGSLCLLFADGFPVSEDESPQIIGPRRVQIRAHPGQHLFLHCEAFANCEADMTIIYWLVNGSFPEDVPSSGRIVESKESTLAEGAILQKSLLLKNVTSEDLKSTFTCVVTNAAGTAHKYTTLTTSSNCNKEKNIKHQMLLRLKVGFSEPSFTN